MRIVKCDFCEQIIATDDWNIIKVFSSAASSEREKFDCCDDCLTRIKDLHQRQGERT